MKPTALALATLALATACGSTHERSDAHDVRTDPSSTTATPEPAWQARDVRVAFSRGGKFLVRWRSTTGEIPKNKHFELDVWLFRVEEDGAFTPLPGATLVVAGWMPDHGHGMVRRPGATEEEPGHYRVAGMLLHMAGSWKVFFDVIDDGYSERTEFDLEL